MTRAEQSTPSTVVDRSGSGGRGRLIRPRLRGLLRSCLLVGTAAFLVPVITVSGPAAQAVSSLNNPLNVLAATEDAAEYARLAAQLGVGQSPEVNEYEARMQATGTTAAIAADGLSTTPRAGGGRVGMVLNTVAVLSGLAFLWPGGDDPEAVPPVLPVPPASAVAVGSANCGWSTVAGTTGCAVTSTSVVTFSGWTNTTPRTYWVIRDGQTGEQNCANFTGCAVLRAGSPAMTVFAGQPSLGFPSVGRIWAVANGSTLPNPSPGVVTDPALVPRYIDSQITCKSPGGGSSNYSRHDGPFTFDPALPYTMPDVPDMVCPEGTWLSDGKRELATEGSTTTVPLQEPYHAPDWVGEQATDFPECAPIGSLQCQLKLFKIGTGTHPEYDCHSYAAGTGNPCFDWATDPNKKDRYECRFGGEVVALKRCSPYADVFSTDVIHPTAPDPDTEIENPAEGVDPTPEQTPNLGDCTPSWSSLLTPWWVFKAQACALKWAFVPQVDTWGIGELKAQMEARPPFSVVIDVGTSVGSFATAYGGAGGCGLLADFSSTGKGSIHAPIYCAAVRDSISGFAVWYTVVQGALWLGWGIYVWRYMSGLFERGN